ncbi:hypothetical protein [Nocardioides gilvus]|uniref:hypothetical protein n=1 Tax=Nocardioides gilvus TaxID=1735589 RepID=UPI000D74A4EA|nr:hypothetical protein [Nocardioides gilvus]
MKKTLTATLSALVLLIGGLLTFSASPTAAAPTCDYNVTCGWLNHVEDNGYDAPIIVRCNYGDPNSERRVAEGEQSSKYCKDIDQVYVRTNEEIHCRRAARTGQWYWWKEFDARGWHKVNDTWRESCVVQRD